MGLCGCQWYCSDSATGMDYFVCDVAHEWVPHPFGAIVMCDSKYTYICIYTYVMVIGCPPFFPELVARQWLSSLVRLGYQHYAFSVGHANDGLHSHHWLRPSNRGWRMRDHLCMRALHKISIKGMCDSKYTYMYLYVYIHTNCNHTM